MALKRQAVPLPDLRGKAVLDIGCDAGAWCFLAAGAGAGRVVGLDRGRDIRGRGFVDVIAENRQRANDLGHGVCAFAPVNVGRQWPLHGRFDVVLMLSVYHHVYEQCGDHQAIWFWLRRHCRDDAELLWEGPVDDTDPVVRRNVSDGNRARYRMPDILAGAAPYFTGERIGPALHEPTREVWRFRPRLLRPRVTTATVQSGAGGAAQAFLHADGRRIKEIERALGFTPVPGSLNLHVEGPFDWDWGYVRAVLLDVCDRALGFESAWAPRWARFYPLTIDGHEAYAMRFEGERYGARMLELIAPARLRDVLNGTARVTVER